MAAQGREAMLPEIVAARHGGTLRAVENQYFLAPEGKPQRGLGALSRRDDQGCVFFAHRTGS